MNIKAVIAGAISGFVSAFLVDLDAWKKAPANEAFDWALALKRWAAGALSGALAGAGFGAL
jgi:hypothetical protein